MEELPYLDAPFGWSREQPARDVAEEPALPLPPPELAPPPPSPALAPPPRPRRIRWRLPLVLFLATCWSTYSVGGPVYSLCLMTILVCHEAGHYIQSRRYGVAASLPYFLPMPFTFLGTMGAVILMDSRVRDRKSLFDIGITGPLAGLVPTILFCILGLCYGSGFLPLWLLQRAHSQPLGTPILFDWLTGWVLGPTPPGCDVAIGPMALAGWVGLLITSLNLFPIGQLDGGHILYGLLRRKSYYVTPRILQAAALAVLVGIFWFQKKEMVCWTVMLVLLAWMGPKHPPTADDHVSLGRVRPVLGWLTLAFLVIGFTPIPLHF